MPNQNERNEGQTKDPRVPEPARAQKDAHNESGKAGRDDHDDMALTKNARGLDQDKDRDERNKNQPVSNRQR